MVVHNANIPQHPYSRENMDKARAEKRQHMTLNIMMNADQSASISMKKDPERVRRGKKAAETRKAKQLEKDVQQQQATGDESGDLTKMGSAQGRGFQPSTLRLYDSLATILKQETGFREQGSHERFGRWPDSFASRTVDPTLDPFGFYSSTIGGKRQGPLTREDFACRPVMFWAPELRFPDFYPTGKPCCPFHPGDTSCVVHNGWSNYYRRVLDDEDGVTALTGREYKCTIQTNKKKKLEGKLHHVFYSYDAAVLCQAPAYVRAWWHKNGFVLSSRSGLRRTIIQRMRSELAHGMSASGFVNMLDEQYHQSHAALSTMWRSYCGSLYDRRYRGQYIPARSLFFPFDDDRSELISPSLNYFIKTTIEQIESYIPFYRHRMTMNGGLFLSGDHFLKIGKVVLVEHERAFVGLYTVMNEFGKVLLWRLVAGTTMHEIEDSLRALNRRYKLHGFKGPIVFSTDRCCQERSFYEGSNNTEKKPIFHSFVPESERAQQEVVDGGGTEPTAQQEAVDGGTERPTAFDGEQHQATTQPAGNIVQYLELNKPPITFSSHVVASASAN